MEEQDCDIKGTMLATLEILPRELHLHIFDFLDYRASIMLSQTSRLFHTTVSPQKCYSGDKTSFVRTIGTSAYASTDDHFGCYLCYRVMPASEFGDKQLLGDRRKEDKECTRGFCIACGFANSIYTLGTRITKGRIHMWFCHVCHLLKDEHACEDCGRCDRCVRSPSADRLLVM